MGRELKIPLHRACRRPQRNYRIGVEIIPPPLVAVEVWTWIASRQEQQIGLAVIGSGQPRRRASVFYRFALPSFRRRIAWRGNRPEPPNAFPRLGLVSGDESSNSFIAARYSRDDQIANHQRRGCRAVLIVRIRHLHVPQQSPGKAMQRQQVRIVGYDKYAVAEHRDPAINPGRCVAYQPLGSRPRVSPYQSAVSGIARINCIHGRNIHDSAYNDWSNFQAPSAGPVEYPARRERVYVLRRDLT